MKKYELTREEERELNQELERSRKKKIENLKAHRILKRESAVLYLLDQTFDILFPPEDNPHIPPETKLLNAVFGRRANVPSEVAEEFVRRVICDAERLVREYNSSEDEK